MKGNVNKGIRNTLKMEPEMFLAYNNGISVTAESVTVESAEDGSKFISKIRDMQIVNGGQTTNRIGKLDIEKDFYLQCKVVKSKGNTTQMKDKFALEIAEATNSQKPVKKADLK